MFERTEEESTAHMETDFDSITDSGHGPSTPSDAMEFPPARLIADTLAGRAFGIAENGSTAPLRLDAKGHAGVRREVIRDYSRGRSGISVYPTTAASVQPLANAPRSEYPVFISKAARSVSIL